MFQVERRKKMCLKKNGNDAEKKKQEKCSRFDGFFELNFTADFFLLLEDSWGCGVTSKRVFFF